MTGMKSGASSDDPWGDADDSSDEPEETVEETAGSVDETSSSSASETASEEQAYIVRRMLEDASTQFERDHRLTFFVRDEVADGEKQLKRQAEDAFDRDIPKFDLREAVYLAAMENPDAVLAKLDEMGYERS